MLAPKLVHRFCTYSLVIISALAICTKPATAQPAPAENYVQCVLRCTLEAYDREQAIAAQRDQATTTYNSCNQAARTAKWQCDSGAERNERAGIKTCNAQHSANPPMLQQCLSQVANDAAAARAACQASFTTAHQACDAAYQAALQASIAALAASDATLAACLAACKDEHCGTGTGDGTNNAGQAAAVVPMCQGQAISHSAEQEILAITGILLN